MLTDFIKQHGYDFSPTELDGSFHSFEDSLGNKGWYVGSHLGSGKVTFTFGDWRSGESFSYRDENLNPQELKDYESKQKDLLKEKTKRQLDAKKICRELFARWERLGSTGESEYLNKKCLPQRIPGTIVKPESPGHVLVVPLRDEIGEVWNFQTIYDSGEKQFFNYAKTKGLHFTLEPREPGSFREFVCEGFATGASVWASINAKVHVAFAASNLAAVLELFPDSSILADFDAATKQKMFDSGHPHPKNIGLEEALALAKKHNKTIYLPVPLGETENKNTDFSDLYIAGGKEAVIEALTQAHPLSLIEETYCSENISSPEAAESEALENETHESGDNSPPPPHNKWTHLSVAPWVNGLEPMPMKIVKGKPVLPEEATVAKTLFDYWKDSLVKSEEGDVFVWNKTHWSQATKENEQVWMQQIMVLHAGLGSLTRYKSVLGLFLIMIPFSKRNLYAPNPFRVTFLNGTLCIDRNLDSWALSFQPHNKLDYCTNLIPHHYDPNSTDKNPLFEETLQNILGDEEFIEKRRAVAQMFGSALAPVYPRLFLLVGKTGSGKSTLVLLASKLVTDNNIANVQPSDFTGFLMESMIGKLVNMVTDIDFVKPISDAVIKQIEDRVPILINRKNKQAIRAPLPAVHIFGANDLPPTLERGSMAHTRRWTFIPCSHFQPDPTSYDKHRSDKILAAGMQGIIAFAVEGLKDLLSNQGAFFVPTSGREKMAAWQTENDPISSFFEDIKRGEIPDLSMEQDGKCYTNVLWESFCAWHQDAYNAKPRIPKMKFYTKVENVLWGKTKFRGNWVFRGVESKRAPVLSSGVKEGNNKFPTGELARAQGELEAGRQVLETSTDLF